MTWRQPVNMVRVTAILRGLIILIAFLSLYCKNNWSIFQNAKTKTKWCASRCIRSMVIGHAITIGSRTEMESMDAKHFVIVAMIRTATAMIDFQKSARNIFIIATIRIAKNIGSYRMLESMVVENHANIVLRKDIESKVYIRYSRAKSAGKIYIY